MEALSRSREPWTRWPRLLIAAALLVLSACAAGGTPNCADGTDRGLKSTGTCGPNVTVTVKSGSSCVPSAFTGFNSELAGFPQATNNDHPVQTLRLAPDGGNELRRCLLTALGDAGFTVSCDLCTLDGGSGDAGCASFGTCQASLVP